MKTPPVTVINISDAVTQIRRIAEDDSVPLHKRKVAMAQQTLDIRAMVDKYYHHYVTEMIANDMIDKA